MDDMRERVIKGLEAYDKKTLFFSFTKRDIPEYAALVSLGKEALPHLFDQLDNHPRSCLSLIREISGDRPAVPAEARGRLELVKKIYKEWRVELGL